MMKKVSISLGVLLVNGAVLAGERLSSSELKAFYTDRTIHGVHAKRGPGKIYFGPDGSVHSIYESGAERMGKWWIDDASDKRCIRWNDKAKDLCHYTERNGDGTHTLVHGKNGKKLVKIKSAEKGNKL